MVLEALDFLFFFPFWSSLYYLLQLEYGWGVFKTCNGFVWIVVSILSVAVRRWLGSI
jgi:hypothetical protein